MLDHHFNFRLGDEEYSVFEAGRAVSGLSRSEYLRRVLMNKPVPNKCNLSNVQRMFAVNADLARLGNLMRMLINALDDAEGDQTSLIEDANNLKNEIRERQSELKACIKQIKVR